MNKLLREESSGAQFGVIHIIHGHPIYHPNHNENLDRPLGWLVPETSFLYQISLTDSSESFRTTEAESHER